jgi:hypothetical protein
LPIFFVFVLQKDACLGLLEIADGSQFDLRGKGGKFREVEVKSLVKLRNLKNQRVSRRMETRLLW